MEEVSALRVSLGLNTADFSRGMQDINRSLRGIRSEFTAASDGTRSWASSLDGLRTRSENLSRTLQVQQQRVQMLRQQYDRVVAAQGEDSRAAQNLATRYNNAIGAMRRTESQLNSTNQRIEVQSTLWGRLARAMDQPQSTLSRFGSNLRNVGSSITTSFGTAAFAVGGALGLAVKSAVSFEGEMSKTGAIAGATGGDLEALRQSALKLGATSTLTASQVAGAQTELAKSGYTTNQIIAAMPGIISAAEASGEDLALVSQTVTSALNSFGLSAGDASKVADILAKSANDSAAGVEDMSYTFKYAAAPAHALGYSLETLSAATEIMANAGIRGETAGTTLRAALLRLVKPPKAAANELDHLGVKIKDSQGKMLPLSNIIEQLNEKTKGMTNAQKTASLAYIFGTEAVSGMLSIVAAGAPKLDELTKSLENSAGASEKTAKQMKNNLKGALLSLQGSFETAKIAIGNELTPAIQKLASGLKKITDGFNNLSPEAKKTIVTIGEVATVGLALGTAFGGITMAVGGVISAWGAITTAAGTLGISLAGLAGPIGIGIAAVGLLTVGAIALKKSMDESKKANLDHAQSLIEEQKSMKDLSTQYESLRDKNKLSNDELLRYRDLQTELKTAKSDQEVQTLSGAMDILQQKSGLSNDELNTMLTLNDQIIKKTPDVKQAYSDRGNAIITNKDALDQVNSRLAENIRLELENQRIKAEANLTQNINNYIAALDQLKAKEQERDTAIKNRDATEQRIATLKLLAQQQLNMGKDQEAQKTIDEIARNEILLDRQNGSVASLANQVTEKQKNVEKTQTEIEKTQDLYDKMINLQLAQVGINAKGSDGISQLDQAIQKTQARITELNNAKNSQGGLNAEQQTELTNLQQALGQYQNAKSEIQNIQGEQQSVNKRIDEGTTKAGSMNKELGKGINKKVGIDDGGKADDLNAKISKSQTKQVTIEAVWNGLTTGMKAAFHALGVPGFAVGTDFAPGGWSLVGEQGPELMYVPRGAQIKTASETNSLLSGNNNNQIMQNVSQQPIGPIIIQSVLNGRVIAEETYQDMSVLINKANKGGARGRGVVMT